MTTADECLDQLDRHLESPAQSWLFGAGISREAGIPLMYPLTDKVKELAGRSDAGAILREILLELPDNSHIEHALSHLGDYVTLAERSKTKLAIIGGRSFGLPELIAAHSEIVKHIAATVRWGFIPAKGAIPGQTGGPGRSIVTISAHQKFIDALFRTVQAGRQERRGPVHLFTTNYDTLLEDALALCEVPYWDGFTGGAVAFRSYRFGCAPADAEVRAHVIKLHGSIDWHQSDDGRVWRVRDGDLYPAPQRRLLIYPQATKYIATQKDPFASQFDLFRRSFSEFLHNVLVVCGYSFGDEHINQEIEMMLTRTGSRTVLVAFSREGAALPDCLTKWRNSEFGRRIYVATEKGLYVGSDGPFLEPDVGAERDWWKFSGVTRLLSNGAAGSIA